MQQKPWIIAITVPPAVEFILLALSLEIPNLFVTDGNGAGVPGPSLFGILWVPLFLYTLIMVPFLLPIYLGNLTSKLTLSFIIVEITAYVFFLLFLPIPKGLPIAAVPAWLQIPVVLLIPFAFILRRASTQLAHRRPERNARFVLADKP